MHAAGGRGLWGGIESLWTSSVVASGRGGERRGCARFVRGCGIVRVPCGCGSSGNVVVFGCVSKRGYFCCIQLFLSCFGRC